MKQAQPIYEFDKFFKQLGKLYIVIIPALIGLYLLTGIYTVGPDEKAIVLTFGKYVKDTSSGMHWHFPKPIGEIRKVKSTKVYKVEIGFRTTRAGTDAEYRDVQSESLMLTKDENIIDLDFVILYRIKNIKKYVFNVKEPEKLVADAAQACIRTIVGNTKSELLLTTGKAEVQIKGMEKLQKLLDKYDSGISVENVLLQDVQPPVQVRNAFKDVASAREDKIKFINQANGYKNDILPKANGMATKLINDAMAYKESRIRAAEGDAERFLQLYEKYKINKEVTEIRMYLETMEKILPNLEKVIIDKEAKNGVINLVGNGVIKDAK